MTRPGLMESERPIAAKPAVVRPPPSRLWLRAMELTASIEANPCRLLADIVAERAATSGTAPALLSDRESLTYADLAGRINQYARWAIAQGIAAGDTVGLLMPNRVDYLAIWLGISKIGGVVALLNTQLSGKALAHCIGAARPRHLIVDASLCPALDTALSHLEAVPLIWRHGAEGERRIDMLASSLDGAPLTADQIRGVSVRDDALLIYTSGTTGLPKAARVSHRRALSWALWFAGLLGASADDRLYDCLPLYHSVGGVVATGCMLAAGGSVVIAEKFSARSFWDDIVRWDCTTFQYIGELCRYLLKAPVSESEKHHRLRIVCGNGLRGDVWEPFKSRFDIPHILEFYAATEGNFSLFNVEEKPGAVGKIPSFLSHRFPAAVVRYDGVRGIPLRDAQGLCVRCAADETGEAIGRIADSKSGGGAFEGYTDAAETEKKILRNVFAAGDAWFRTGDLMRRDSQGFFYFIDRIGDTFRWKGENVATLEVAEAVAAVPGVIDASVYGVAVPHHDGRAGMAALVVDATFDHVAFHRALVARLPSYALPLFLRLSSPLALTETFKQKKQQLVEEGFDPNLAADPLFFKDAQAGSYVPLDAALFARITRGDVKL